SIALTVGTLFFAIRHLVNADYLFSWNSLWKHVRWRRIGAIVLLIAGVSWVIRAVTNPLIPAPNSFTILYGLILGSITKPLCFLVAHTVYFGPIILLTFLLWPE